MSKSALHLPLLISVCSLDAALNTAIASNEYQSFARHILKKSSASKGAAFENSHHSSKSASSFQKTPSPSTLPKSRTVVCQPLLNVNPSATSYSMVWL